MSKNNLLVIATRQSFLAWKQAQWVQARLKVAYPSLLVNLLGLTTQADQLTIPLREIGGKGLFVKELEEALLDGRANIAVHSAKDLPMELHPELALLAVCAREEVRDVFVSTKYSSWQELPKQSVVGTSSLRRQSQLYALRPDLIIRDLRGNIETRLRKLDEGQFDAIILAGVGLKRLGLEARICSYFTPQEILPAAGQGVIGIEGRLDDQVMKKYLEHLNHAETYACVLAERSMCLCLQGNCRVPIAAYAYIETKKIHLSGLVANKNGSVILRASKEDTLENAKELGQIVATSLMEQGAKEVLRSCS